MYFDLKGRIKNTPLNPHQCLLPIFETIINSIQAIEDSTSNKKGKIKIEIVRDASQKVMDFESREQMPIRDFVIEDNGIGFADENMKAFETADTTYRVIKGGKGVGRFLWLKAFDKVEIHSVYFDNKSEEFKNRKLHFSIIDEINVLDNERANFKTSFSRVSLLNYKDIYRDDCPKKAETIALRIIEHCFSFFLRSDCPEITLIDDEIVINLNSLFKDNVEEIGRKITFQIDKHKFTLIGFKFFSAEERYHKLHYLADGREVSNDNLHSRIPLLPSKRLPDSNGGQFLFSAYLISDYLNENTNQERTSFTIPESYEYYDSSEISGPSLSSIREKCIDNIKEQLKDILDPINEEKEKQIASYVNYRRPEFRPLLKYKRELIDKVPPGLTDEKLDLELRRIKLGFEDDISQKTQKILNEKPGEIKNDKEYQEELNEYFRKVNDLGRAQLAQYVLHRKTILQLLEKRICINENKMYEKEDAVHQLICPLKVTSDEQDFENHNLWVIDEKLVYHEFLTSDLPLKNFEPISVDSNERPDLMALFDNPLAFGEGEPSSSVIIIEFKRPMRTNIKEKGKDPITQVYGYIRKIRDGKETTYKGRPFSNAKDLRFYGYIICDLTDQIRVIAENNQLRLTPDGEGYYTYNPNLSAYIEIISYTKLISDSKKRNQAFFNELNLP